MTLPDEGKLLRIFIGESDRHENMPLFEWIVRKAREQGIAGATVVRGLEGYGARSLLHTSKILRLSSDLPVIIEIVDTAERIEAFLPQIDEAIGAWTHTPPLQLSWVHSRPSPHWDDDEQGYSASAPATGASRNGVRLRGVAGAAGRLPRA